jgi:two-component sensor histidine kinase
LHVEALVIDPDRLAPLALFAVEAITNAQKHAFAGRGGTLRVRFRVDDGEAELQIADSGSGRPYCEPEGGVGRLLMNAFARQLRGRLEMSHNDMGGCTVRLNFPAPEVKPAGEARPRARSAKAGAGVRSDGAQAAESGA